MSTLRFCIASVMIMLLFINVAKSQTEESETLFKGGILIGGTMSNISAYDGDIRSGFVGGIYLEKALSNKFTAITDISYAQRGAKGNDNVSSVRLDYLSFPLMLQYNITQNIGIITGIAWDDLIGVKGNDISRDDIKEDDWRVPVGLAYHITDKLKLGIQYNFGLTDISSNSAETNKNNWGSLTIAYLFKVK